MLIRVDVLVGPPGCGKTTEMNVEMVSVKRRYLLSLGTIDLIAERLADLHREAAKSGTDLIIRVIHSAVANRRSVAVSREIMDAVEECSCFPHVILIVTHEAMMATDFSCVDGANWHMRIDEVPSAMAAGELRIPALIRFFEMSYDVSPVAETEWSRVSQKADAPSLSDMMRDDLGYPLAAFHKRVRSPQGVFVDVPDWRDGRERGRSIRWWSAWTPAELCSFSSICIAAAGFFHSLTYLATRKWFGDEVEFVRREVTTVPRSGTPRVVVRYFTHGHRGSTNWWFPKERKTPREGKRCLVAVCRYLERIHDLGYWSGNTDVLDYFEGRMGGEQVRPKVAGSNQYRHHTSCALIYSNKPQKDDAVLMRLFGLTRDEIERAREQEDVWQFVMRGAIRNWDFDGTYTVYLYDLAQAEVLAQMLRDSGIADDVVMEPVPQAGILDVQRPKPGPKPLAPAAASAKSYDEKQEDRRDGDRRRKQAQRERERAEKVAAGTLRPRGRPPKADGGAARP